MKPNKWCTHKSLNTCIMDYKRCHGKKCKCYIEIIL